MDLLKKNTGILKQFLKPDNQFIEKNFNKHQYHFNNHTSKFQAFAFKMCFFLNYIVGQGNIHKLNYHHKVISATLVEALHYAYF